MSERVVVTVTSTGLGTPASVVSVACSECGDIHKGLSRHDSARAALGHLEHRHGEMGTLVLSPRA